ncbi:MAG: PQQ-dependent dehydrogenase, methanol/ethanol family [bacterium]
MTRQTLIALMLVSLLPTGAAAQVTFERLLNADEEPENWLTYSGSYSSNRHTKLDQITPDNVEDLELSWVFQAGSLEAFQATPLVVDGIMYLTEPVNNVVALDAKRGSVFWKFEYTPSSDARPCCGAVNRGLAILDDTLFLATLDGNLIALDAVGGKPLWQTTVADPTEGYALTLAPLVIKDKVMVGVAGGEYGIRGYIDAYDAKTGELAWRFYTIPGPGEPGHETWENDAWKTGGAPAWLTGSYDPDLDLTYWGIGNPGPDLNPAQRPGDNLYSDSVVALDPDTGELEWYFQFTPNDPYDYDSVQIPVLIDFPDGNGNTQKLMLWGNRNGFFYVLDRESGQFLSGTSFVPVNWASGLDDFGRPVQTPQPPGATTFPGIQGGTNWYSPSYSPETGLFYVSAWEAYGSNFEPQDQTHVPGRVFLGGRPANPFGAGANVPGLRRGHINNWTDAAGGGAVIAIDPRTGQQRWRVPMTDVTSSGILTSASNLLFTGNREGHFHVMHAETGELLLRKTLGGMIANGPMSYMVDGKQYVAIAAGHSMFVYSLRD